MNTHTSLRSALWAGLFAQSPALSRPKPIRESLANYLKHSIARAISLNVRPPVLYVLTSRSMSRAIRSMQLRERSM